MIYARKNRNWKEFDRLDEVSKLRHILQELQIYEDDIDVNYDPMLKRI